LLIVVKKTSEEGEEGRKEEGRERRKREEREGRSGERLYVASERAMGLQNPYSI
jgi:hypothetical protein